MSISNESEAKEILFSTNNDENVNTVNEQAEVMDPKEVVFSETPYRYLVCMSYCLLSFGNAIQWVTYSSTAFRFEKYFGYSRLEVDLFSMIFMITYPIGCIPQGYIIDNISVRLGLSIASITTIVGAGLKVLTGYHSAWAYIGQILTSSFQPCILNSPAKIASVWFRDERRALVTVICYGSNSIGIFFGYIYHTFFIAPETEYQDYKDQFFNYLLWSFVLEAIICFPILLMDSKPKIPVSNSQYNYESPPLLETLKLLIKNKPFIYMAISSTCLTGFINIYGTIINPYMAMYGVSDEDASYAAAIANGVGIFSSICISFLLDKSKKFKLYLTVLNFLGIACFILFTILLEVVEGNHFYILIVVYTLIFSAMLPIASTGMDYVCELVYPVGESVSGGLMMCCNQVSGIIGVLIVNALMEYYPTDKYATNIMGIVFFVISVVALIRIKEDLARSKKEEERPARRLSVRYSRPALPK